MSVVKDKLERLEQDLTSKKEELAQLEARKKDLEASGLSLNTCSFCPGFQGCERVLQLAQVHPKRKGRVKKKDTLACPHRRGRSTISHT